MRVIGMMREMKEVEGNGGRLWPWPVRFPGSAGLWPLFANESLRGIAISWLALFSSIFIYQELLHFLDQRLALGSVFLFWAVFGLTKLLGTSLAENLSLRRGLKTQVGLGLATLALAALLFSLASFRPIILLLAIVCWGFSDGLYWFGWHGLIGKLQDRNHYGWAYGTSSALKAVTSILTPFLGGFLIVFGGYPLLFGVALAIIVVALFSLRFLRGEKTHHDATIKDVFVLFASNPKDFFANFSLGALGVIEASFILYLFLVLKTELALGGFFSFSLILVVLIRFLVGRLIDLGKRERLTVVGCFARGLVWLGRMVTKSIPALLGLNIVNDLAASAVGMPLEVLALEKGINGHSMGRAILFREAAISLGKVASGVVLGVMFWLGLPLTSGFVLAIPLSLVPILIYDKNK